MGFFSGFIGGAAKGATAQIQTAQDESAARRKSMASFIKDVAIPQYYKSKNASAGYRRQVENLQNMLSGVTEAESVNIVQMYPDDPAAQFKFAEERSRRTGRDALDDPGGLTEELQDIGLAGTPAAMPEGLPKELQGIGTPAAMPEGKTALSRTQAIFGKQSDASMQQSVFAEVSKMFPDMDAKNLGDILGVAYTDPLGSLEGGGPVDFKGDPAAGQNISSTLLSNLQNVPKALREEFTKLAAEAEGGDVDAGARASAMILDPTELQAIKDSGADGSKDIKHTEVVKRANHALELASGQGYGTWKELPNGEWKMNFLDGANKKEWGKIQLIVSELVSRGKSEAEYRKYLMIPALAVPVAIARAKAELAGAQEPTTGAPVPEAAAKSAVDEVQFNAWADIMEASPDPKAWIKENVPLIQRRAYHTWYQGSRK